MSGDLMLPPGDRFPPRQPPVTPLTKPPVDIPPWHAVLRAMLRAISALLNPRVWWLTAAPFLISALIWGAIFWLTWESAIARVQSWLGQWPVLSTLESTIAVLGVAGLHLVLAPFLVVALTIPLIVATILVVIGATSMPAVVSHLARRRYANLAQRRGGSFFGSLTHSLVVTAIFLVLMVCTLPLWWIPPFLTIVPPVLWGWLTCRVMSYDALALHASPEERRTLLRQHRWPLLFIGVVTGLMGALPALIWASSLIAIVLFPLIALISVWLYVLIFVFSALWFTHYCLAALETLRAHNTGAQTTHSTTPH